MRVFLLKKCDSQHLIFYLNNIQWIIFSLSLYQFCCILYIDHKFEVIALFYWWFSRRGSSKVILSYCALKFSYVLYLQANRDFQKFIARARNNIFWWGQKHLVDINNMFKIGSTCFLILRSPIVPLVAVLSR